MSSIRWLLLIIAVNISPVWGNGFLNECNDATKTTPFRIEIQENYYSEFLEWKLFQIGVGEVESERLPEGNELYEEQLCLDPSGCYRFGLEHEFGNALGDGGSYSIFYDDNLIASGGAFSGNLESIQFGNECESSPPSSIMFIHPTLYPTQSYYPTIGVPPVSPPAALPPVSPPAALPPVSQPAALPPVSPPAALPPSSPPASLPPVSRADEPSSLPSSLYYYSNSPFGAFPSYSAPTNLPTDLLSDLPTVFPADLPSDIPSSLSKSSPSTMPSTTLYPTYLPTESSKPTDAVPLRPTEPQEGDDGRLRFPELQNRAEAQKFRSNILPDCTDLSGRVGCVALPSTLSNPTPDWAGNIHFSPPTCSLNQFGRNKRCKMGIPMSIDVVEDDINLSIFPKFQENMIFGNTINTQRTESIVVGDLNGDGHLDIVTGFHSRRNERWMNNADGTFTRFELQGEEAGPTRTNSIALGDLNGDNRLDIIIGNRETHRDQVLLSTPDNSYEAIELPNEQKIGAFPDTFQETTAIALGDIDGDGNLDIVVGRNVLSDTTILLNSKGNGRSYVEHIQFKKPIKTISIGDIDNDGKVDIVYGTGQQDKNLIQVNNGNMNFNDVLLQPLEESAVTRAIGLADLNGDGLLDVVVVNAGRNVDLVYTNDKNGNLNRTIPTILPGGDTQTADIGLGDINGDGRVDIIVQTVNGANNALLNKGGGKYDLNILPEQDGGSSVVALGDLNGDGSLDIVFGMNRNAVNTVLLNDIDNFAYETRRLQAGGSDVQANAVVLADMNGDGILDVVVANEGAENQIYMSDKDGNYVSVPIRGDLSDAETLSRAIAIGDLNNDGIVDVVVGNNQNADQIFIGRKDNSFDVVNLLSMTFMGKTLNSTVLTSDHSATTSIAIGDLDKDGRLDIVMGYQRIGDTSGANQVFYQDEGGKFTAYDLPGDDSSTNAIALGDFDGDEFLDIASANQGQNQVLLYKGNRTFTVTNLPVIASATTSIAVGDVNGDGFLDIVLGTPRSFNNVMLLNSNGSGMFNESIVLPETEGETSAIALGDFNGDSLVDIIFGNNDRVDNLLLNRNNNIFSMTDLPSESQRTRGIAIGDLDGDGFVEVVSIHQSNVGQVTFYSTCPNGGSRPFTGSGCFRCPVYTGRPAPLLNYEQSSCVECLPDILQQTGDGERCSAEPCFLSERKLGSKTCDTCRNGTLFDNQLVRSDKNRFSWEPDRCVECPPGGYCSSGGGDFIPCLPGTYNERPGQSSISACLDCGVGTFSTITGANTSTVCGQCPAGSFGNRNRSSTFTECIPCPNRLSSGAGSNDCPFCAEGFYLEDPSYDAIDLFNQSNKCKECPSKGVCIKNTTIATIGIPVGYWRATPLTATLIKCDNKVCKGQSIRDKPNDLNLSSIPMDALYCVDGHTGPLCEVCIDRETTNKHFSPVEGKCINCPIGLNWRPIIVILSIVIGVLLFRMAIFHYNLLYALVTRGIVIIYNIGPQAKFKLLISFYQVVSTLESVYGLQFDPIFKMWFNFLQLFNLEYFTILPSTCIGSMSTRLVFTATWPFVTIFIGCIFIYIHGLLTRGEEDNSTLKTKVWRRALTFTIIFIYIVIPGVSRRIFDAYVCQPFVTNDRNGETHNFLVADPIIQCDDPNSGYASVRSLFWILLIIWPILIPLLFFGLLWKIKHLLRAKRTTPLADACSFLWRDYNEECLYWEIMDLYRKLFLTGFILFIDPLEGSTKILRIVVASGVSLIYTGVLLRVRPYQHASNINIAFVSNILLTLCFSLGIILHFCEDNTKENTEAVCQEFVGQSFNSFNASLIVVLLTTSMLVVAVVFLAIFAKNAIVTPSVRVISTGSKPNLELPGHCKFHAFFSHIWSTGKDKTHVAVRKMQLFLPGVRIWLDADELTNVGNLEQSVDSSAVFLIFYTEGYFRSKNCQREVYAAVDADKPIYIIYESDIHYIEGTKEDMKEECFKYCNEGENILERVFANDPIPWLGSGGSSFAIESIKLVSLAILRHLPFYARFPDELEKGVHIGGEYGPLKFPSLVDILVCEENVGARRIAEELKTHLPQTDRSINICDAKLVLDGASEDSSILTTGNTNYLLLYLDEDIFLDDNDEVSQLVRMAIGMGVKVITVHELDYTRGACKFDEVFKQTPENLKGVLYNDIAVPLYPSQEYRQVSFRSLLTHIGANETGNRPLIQNYLASASLLLKNSLSNRDNSYSLV